MFKFVSGLVVAVLFSGCVSTQESMKSYGFERLKGLEVIRAVSGNTITMSRGDFHRYFGPSTYFRYAGKKYKDVQHGEWIVKDDGLCFEQGTGNGWLCMNLYRRTDGELRCALLWATGYDGGYPSNCVIEKGMTPFLKSF